MPINIGNSSSCEVYAGSTAIKEIYAGSNLVWSKAPSLKLTLDTSKVTQDLSDYFLCVEICHINGDEESLDVYLNNEKKDYHFSNNQFVYSDVSDGDKVELRLDADENYWENPSIELDKDGETITIDGQTKVTLVVTDKPSDSSSILTLDTSNVTNDLSSHYVRLRVKNVNGEHRDEKIYLNEGEGDYHFSNDQFIYSNISNGDEVELRLVSDGAYLNVLFDYNGYETDTVSVTINGQTNVEVDVVDRYVDNIVEIPYDAIQEAFGNIFYDDPGAKLTIEIKMYNVYGVGNYTETYTYTYTGEDYTDNSDIIAFAEAVNIVKTIYPNSATWSISYYEDGVNAGTVDVTGSISFSEEEDFHFVGTFDV